MLKLLKFRKEIAFLLDMWHLIEVHPSNDTIVLTKDIERKLQSKWKKTATRAEVQNAVNHAVHLLIAAKKVVS